MSPTNSKAVTHARRLHATRNAPSNSTAEAAAASEKLSTANGLYNVLVGRRQGKAQEHETRPNFPFLPPLSVGE